ncbi:MAG: T9SS type A sorting domain-containing protein [Ignavibacteria bacterium]|nr:T9SS type A sorting domain-containing protein [Ignavibacteria bacterium]
MKKIILLISFILIPVLSIAQDLFIQNNPYDNAEDFVKDRNAFNRERWFNEQRMYPLNYFPENAYGKALDTRNELRNNNGYFMNSSNSWTSIGPTSGSYFSYGNISSRITAIKYDPNNPSVVYLGAAFGGVWKSTNGGTSWTAKMNDEASLSSGAIAIDPDNSNIIYYGTGEATYSGTSYYGRGLLKSTDGGNTWTNYTTGIGSFSYFSRIVIRPGHSNELLAALGTRSGLGVTGGLYRSTDAGVTWTSLVNGRCDDVVFSPDGNNAYAIGSGTGYRISTNGGAVFTTNTSLSPATRNHLAICKSFPNIMYSAIHSGSSISVFKSIDGGLTFTPSSPGFDFSGSQAWYDFYVHVNPFNPDYAYVGSIDTWRTTNGGASYQNITFGYSGGTVHVDQQNMDFNPVNQDEMFCTNDGGVWKSTDKGTSWSNMNSSLTLTQFYRIASDPSNASHVMGGTQDNGTQRTLGTINWTGAFGGDGAEVCFHSVNPQYILGESQNNGVQRSQNGGASWTSGTSGLSGTASWVAPILSHPDSAGIFYTARQQVFKSTNWGASWSAISSGTSGTIREMAICTSSPDIMYATSGSQIYKSVNRGYTYSLVTNGLPNKTITSVYIHPDSSSVVVVTQSGFGGGHIFKTTNGGNSWINISGNLPDSPANDALIYYPGSSTSVYLIATDVGVFITNNYGGSWSELADGLPNTVAMHLDYNRASNKIRIGTHGRGVYEITNLTGIPSISAGVPQGFSLDQNYPNPFNPSTTIKYNIPEKGNVSLKIYDVIGREVASLVDQIQEAGNYEILFNASSLSSGVYYYKIFAVSNGFSETKSMILLK